MKWIKKRQHYLAEAKIRDVLKPMQVSAVAKKWGKKYLDYEEIEPADDIKEIQDVWKLTPEQKYAVLNLFFGTDVRKAEAAFENLPTDFIRSVSAALNAAIEEDSWNYDSDIRKKIEPMMADGIDFGNIGLEEIAVLTEPVLARIDVKTTVSDKAMLKDEEGLPVKGEDGNFVFEPKELGEMRFYSGIYNLNSFAQDYNKCAEKMGWEKVDRSFASAEIGSIKNIMDTKVKGHEADLKVFHKDAYLSIKHNAQDILNISVSKFFSSCQDLYGGSHSDKLLANVFDPNSVPAFIYLDSPVYSSDGEVIADKLPLARFVIRLINAPGDSRKLLFDRVYPQRMDDGTNSGVYDLVEEIAGIKRAYDAKTGTPDDAVYVFAPDISSEDSINAPYQDTIQRVERKMTIGRNCRYLNVSADSDWSDVIVRKDNRIEEMVISTPKVPQNLFDMDFNLKWLKIVNIDIKEMPDLSKFGTGDISLVDCRATMEDLRKGLEGVELKRLMLNRCDIEGINLDGMQLDELVLKTTVDAFDTKLSDVLGGARIKSLTISDDLLQDEDNVLFLREAVARKQIGQWKKEGLLSKRIKNKKK